MAVAWSWSALVVIALGSAPARQDLALRASEGAVLTKHARTLIELELAAGSLTVNGIERARADHGYVAAGGGHRIEREVVVTDRYELVARGEPYRFRRDLERVRGRGWTRARLGAGEDDWERASRLETETLRIEWDERADEYDVQLVDDAAELRLLLDEVSADMDLLALLPSEPQDPGSRWRVDPRRFVDALRFGGELDAFPRNQGRREPSSWDPWGGLPGLPEDLGTWLDGLHGEVAARYVAREEHEGARLARVRFEFELGAEVDLAPEAGQGARFSLGGLELAELAWKTCGTAELLWDLETGHLRSFELEAELEARVEAESTYVWDFSASPRAAQGWTRNRVRSEERWRGTVAVAIGLGDPFDDGR